MQRIGWSVTGLRSMARPALLAMLAVLGVVSTAGCAAPASIGSRVVAPAPGPATVIVGVPDPGFPTPDPQDPNRASTLRAVETMLAATVVPPGSHRVSSSPTPAVDLLFHGPGPDVAVTLTIDGPGAGAQVQVLGTAQPTLGGYGTSGPPPLTVDAAVMSALGLPHGFRK